MQPGQKVRAAVWGWLRRVAALGDGVNIKALIITIIHDSLTITVLMNAMFPTPPPDPEPEIT
ncbi:MAG: hypothetical protein KAT56_10090 [Sedimentisphaerales bacterium]|nr:hypothetical protein [Sedimentisphaerales bacterium]